MEIICTNKRVWFRKKKRKLKHSSRNRPAAVVVRRWSTGRAWQQPNNSDVHSREHEGWLKLQPYLWPIRAGVHCCHSVMADMNNHPVCLFSSLCALLLLPWRKFIWIKHLRSREVLGPEKLIRCYRMVDILAMRTYIRLVLRVHIVVFEINF